MSKWFVQTGWLYLNIKVATELHLSLIFYSDKLLSEVTRDIIYSYNTNKSQNQSYCIS